MKKVLLALLALVVVLGLFAAVGYTGYRVGYAQGARVAAKGDRAQPGPRLFDDFGRRGMPNLGDRFGRGFRRGFGPAGFPMRGFGFFAPLRFLVQIAVLALIVWFVYWLLTRSGWRLARTVPTTEVVETEVKEEDQGS